MVAVIPKHSIIADVNEFLHIVLTDGRYVQGFQQRPYEVALALGVEISPDVAAQVMGEALELLLKEQPPSQIIGNQAGGIESPAPAMPDKTQSPEQMPERDTSDDERSSPPPPENRPEREPSRSSEEAD